MKQTTERIIDPINRDRNPMVRGQGYTKAHGVWPVELLSPAERRSDAWSFIKHYVMLGVIAQLASGSIPFLSNYQLETYLLALFLLVHRLSTAPAIMEASFAIFPFCLVPYWHTEWAALRAIVCWTFPIYAAYQFRRHLMEFVSAAPLPPSEGRAYRKTGILPPRATSAPFVTGSLQGFWLGVTSWITYLGNEQQLPSVFRSPAGVWHSRTFATTFGVFGCSFLLPTDVVLGVSGTLLAMIHPLLVVLAVPLAVVGPVLAMGALAFLFSADRLCSAWSLKQYAKLENTFADLVGEISQRENADA